ncbi:MAG TPA: SCP2 sterol-binding domain-containing protein [Acidimicrobiales bacterium]|nr:SCP2 sterol-binding domain-containing protein [Acidimicrobiales bacterium]
MVKFLTDEWVWALDHEASAQVSPIADTFVVEYRVELAANESFVYQIRFAADAVTVRAGSPSPPTVVLSTDRLTAQGVATNTMSAQAAFMAGQLRLEGDTMAMVRNHDALAALGEIFAAVRTKTEY